MKLAPIALLGLFSLPAHSLEIVASIAPLGQLAAAITAGVSQPKVLLQANTSPHDAALKPSQIRQLQQADLVLWVGPELESFLTKPLAQHPQAIALTKLPTMPLHQYSPAEEHHADKHTTEHEHEHEHHHGSIDPHLWLGLAQIEQAATALTDKLATLDPANQATYQANRKTLMAELQQHHRHIQADMQAVSAKGYVVFHDAYGYWEQDFKMHPKAIVTVHPEQRPGVKTIQHIRAQLTTHQAACLFAEPQFSPAVIQALAKGTQAQVFTLDPLGSTIPINPKGLLQLRQTMAASFQRCLQHQTAKSPQA